MDQSIAAKVEKYLETFGEIRNKVADDRVALAILTETAKDRRMDEMREEREARNGEPATTRQLQFLKKLGAILDRVGMTAVHDLLARRDPVATSTFVRENLIA